ncbi:MAG: acetyl-CoA acetyltransferase [Iamia sp.]
MTNGVWILGGSQTDFARSVAKEGLEIDALVGEATRDALDEAGVGAERIDVIHVGNAFGPLLTGQSHLGAMPATVDERLWGKPASRHEAACASGSIAILSAMADLESGRYDIALVLGVEVERSVPGDEASRHLGAAAWVGHEGTPRFVWPSQFSDLADEYDHRYGLDDAHLHALAGQAFTQARDNPLAQTRQWRFTDASFTGDDQANPVVEGRTRRNDCSQITDGAAAVVLASDRAVRADPGLLRRGPVARIAGWGHRTVGLPLARKLERSADDTHVLPHVRDTFRDALDRAQVGAVDDLDAVEVHDCFAMSAYMAIDHLGITAPGDSWKAVEAGEVARDGRIPVNPGGGLIGGGHPVGATGVRMVVDATRQVTHRAGATQVDGARRIGTLNIGGSTATTCAFVVTTEDGR